jgi:hypothetical protein
VSVGGQLPLTVTPAPQDDQLSTTLPETDSIPEHPEPLVTLGWPLALIAIVTLLVGAAALTWRKANPGR